MTTTNSWLHVCERGLIGAVSSTLVCGPSAVNWYFANIHRQAELQDMQIGFGIALLTAWFLGWYITIREPEPHIWNCIFKAAGVPGVLIGASQALQVTVN